MTMQMIMRIPGIWSTSILTTALVEVLIGQCYRQPGHWIFTNGGSFKGEISKSRLRGAVNDRVFPFGPVLVVSYG